MSEEDLPATKRLAVPSASSSGTPADEQITEAAPRHAGYRAIPRTTLPTPLGPYVLERRLGIGGMAEVFLARKDGPAGFTKQIVLKRILPHLAEDQRFVEMFLREAQTAAELNHTNIVQVYELGQADGQYYIAMEFVDGVTLYRLARRAWKKGRSIPMEVILRAVADAALGLHHAHTMKDASGRKLELVHRDISPDNLIISREGMTKVLDFGIAKGAQSQGVTKTGELKGKIPYMSPEQIRGDPLDGRSDLYSLGVTLYWLLTGQRPFDGATELMTLQGVLANEALPPSQVNPHIPPAIDEIVLSLLEKDPKNRPRSGAELHDELVELSPMRTTESGRFVGEMIDVADDDAPASMPASGGFVPSTPLTTKLSSGQRRVIRRKPAGLVGSRRLVAMLVGGALALTIGALGAWLAVDPDGAREPVEVLPAAASPTPAPLAAAVPPAPAPSEAATTTGRDEGQKPEGDEPAAAPTAADPPSKVAEQGAPEPKDAAAGQKRQQRRSPKSRRADVTTRTVTTKAPAGVSWSLKGGKTLGRGSGSLQIPAGVDVLIATASDTQGRSRVRVSGDAVDYNSLGSGRLSLRVFPFAKVSVGNLVLGTTPLSPVTLLEGTYKVKLEHEGRVVMKTVQIDKGSISKLKVDMRSE